VKKLKNNIMSLMMSFSLAAPALVPAVAVAQPDIKEGLCEGANLQVGATDCNEDNPEDTVNNIITTVINIFSLLVGVVAVIMIIIGGIKYITSGGDSNNISAAKTTIIYAIIGLVIVALAQVIVRFVLTRVQAA